MPRDFEAWRERARTLLCAGVPPEQVDWDGGLFAGEDPAPSQPAPRIPRPLLRLLELAACHSAPDRWALMYRYLWRATRGEAARGDAADPDLVRLQALAKSVAKEVHRMHAFVRFRETRDAAGETLHVAWFEPEHDILRRAAPFFVDRFAALHWLIVTPRGAARWDRRRLRFIDGPHGEPELREDFAERLWRTYYAHIFNPARANLRLLEKEMPRRYWRNLPEAAAIGELARAAAPRVAQMHEARTAAPRWSAHLGLAAEEARPENLAQALQACRRCPLWERATQAVCGAGPASAPLALVGEQPGDEEDLRGAPFVGPAGAVLDRALAAAGIERSAVYVTNAVKHFKWEPRGRRRLHKTPAQREVDACAQWLERELDAVAPRIAVALGATAAAALLGERLPIASLRGRVLPRPRGPAVVATYHPAAVLRAEEGAAVFAALVEDLRLASGSAVL